MCHCPEGLPDRLRPHGRPKVQDFLPEEGLYFRFPPPKNEGEEIRDLDVAHIRFPNQSVNWDRFSEPEDVIFGAPPGTGIASVSVQSIPSSITSEGGPVYYFGPVHDPLECTASDPRSLCNYAHVEIQVFRENEEKEKVNIREGNRIPKNVKLKYRAMIRDAARVHTPSRKLAA